MHFNKFNLVPGYKTKHTTQTPFYVLFAGPASRNAHSAAAKMAGSAPITKLLPQMYLWSMKN